MSDHCKEDRVLYKERVNRVMDLAAGSARSAVISETSGRRNVGGRTMFSSMGSISPALYSNLGEVASSG